MNLDIIAIKNKYVRRAVMIAAMFTILPVMFVWALIVEVGKILTEMSFEIIEAIQYGWRGKS